MKFIDLLPRTNNITIAISGLNKNAGKTVVLNKLIDDAVAIGKTLAITSIGYDGEKTDMLDGHQKPQIYVPSGTIVATASSLIEKTNLDLEIIAATGQYTPLGEVYIVRYHQHGYCEIVGPSSLNGLIKAKDIMCKYADIVVVDGALNRISQMSPKLCDAAFFAVGGNDNIGNLVTKVRDQFKLFNIPKVSHDIKNIVYELIKENQCALISQKNVVTKIENQDVLNKGVNKNHYVFYNGAITFSVLKALNSKYKAIIIPDTSNVFVPPKLLHSLTNKGLKLYVGNKMPLTAITLNPQNTKQCPLDILKLGCRVSTVCPTLPVVDVVTSLYFKGGALFGKLD